MCRDSNVFGEIGTNHGFLHTVTNTLQMLNLGLTLAAVATKEIRQLGTQRLVSALTIG
jgi:hypothetical protein